MENYELEDIQEIIVTLKDGKKFKFVDGGLNRFFRLVAMRIESPPLEVEEENDEFIEDSSAKGRSKKKSAPPAPAAVGGYTAFHLDYSPQNNAGRSPMDIAKEMQKQAHGKINFN